MDWGHGRTGSSSFNSQIERVNSQTNIHKERKRKFACYFQ